MKKLLSVAIAAALVVLSAAPALAHGSHHSSGTTVRPAVCATSSCTLTGPHIHDGRTYAAHYYGDGHDYHDYCGIADCALTGYHSHDDAYCFGHTANDGHSYHRTGKGHH